MNASLRAIHATFLGAITVIKQFGCYAIQLRSLRRVEDEHGHSRTVLPKIDNQIFSRIDNDRLSCPILTL